jgi:hypothetical protein
MPTQLPVVLSSRELLNLAIGCHGSYQDYSDDLDDKETDLVGGFIQNVSDWADLAEGLEPIERIRAAKSLDEEIKTLMEGGISDPSIFRALHLSVKRGSDPGVVAMENEVRSSMPNNLLQARWP